MNARKLLFIVLISVLAVFSVFLVKQKTDDIREQEAAASGLNLKIATDPNFQEFEGEIVAGFPEDFPVFPGAVLIGSAINNPPGIKDSGYRVKWLLPKDEALTEIINWYKRELKADGWVTDNPDSWEGISELVLQIERGNLKGYIAAEHEDDEIELVADVRVR
jgi:hypothetical protein